ncbi:MAG: hypothetical protein AB1774_09655 [Bacillota bacterium]
MFRTSLSFALAMMVLFAVAAPSGSALSAGISIRVSPASIVAAVQDGDTIGPIIVANPGDSAIDIEGCVQQGGHDEGGIPVCRPYGNPSAEGVFVTLDPAEFRLSPGASRAVRAKVHVTPGFSGGAYPVILFRGSPATRSSGHQLGASSQVAVLTLLTVTPRRQGVRAEAKPVLVSVGVAQDTSKAAIKVFATCENKGNLHADLGGVVVMRQQDGKVAAEAVMPTGVCLPGYRRTLIGSVAGTCIGSGAYVAEVRVQSSGREVESALVAFRVDDGNRIASTHLDLGASRRDRLPSSGPNTPRVAKVSVPAVSSGWNLPVEVCLENPNTSDLDPIGYVEIWDYQMRRVGLVALGGARVAPGDPAVIRLIWPEPLPPGYYTARATLQWGNQQKSASTAFVVGESAVRHKG